MDELLLEVTQSPPVQSLLVAASALVSEDAAGLASGTLLAGGQIGYGTAFLGLAGGIALGDALIFGLGRAAGSKLAQHEHAPSGRMARAAAFFRRYGPWTIVGARCIPGTRLPTYLAAGALQMSWATFLRTAVPAAMAWAALLLLGIRHLGKTIEGALGSPHWLFAAAAVVLAGNLWIAHRLRSRALRRGAPATAASVASGSDPSAAP